MKTHYGKFILIEGTDGTGKSFQASLLKNNLCERGYGVQKKDLKNNQVSLLEDEFMQKGFKVETDDYPRYESSEWGKLVGRMLTGEFGELMTISPYLAVLPYMIDQYWGSQQIKKWLRSGRYVISNRYFTSNVHQVAKLEGATRDEYRDWIWRMGWKEMKILKPDLVIVLKVELEVCRQNVLKKTGRKYTGEEKMDQAEADFDHQVKAAEEYQWMIDHNPGWWVGIECCENGKMITPERISDLVWQKIKDQGLV